MQQISRSKIFIMPLALFILCAILATLLLRTKGILIFIFVFNPLLQFINQLFTRYQISRNSLIIKELFSKKEYPLESIRYVKEAKANLVQKYVYGYSDYYQIVGYHTYDERPIFPKKDLIFHADSQTLYFKT